MSGPMDAIFGKIGGRGDSLIFSTYFGGSGADEGGFLAVDPSGNAYISGWTSSADFPATPGAFQTSFAGPPFDAFLVKIAELQTSQPQPHPGWAGSPGFSSAGGVPR